MFQFVEFQTFIIFLWTWAKLAISDAFVSRSFHFLKYVLNTLLSLSPRHGSRIRGRRAMRGISALNTPLSTVGTFAWPELERALSPWTVGAVVVVVVILVVLVLLLVEVVVGNNRDDPQPVLRITRFPAHH